jgi:hypothetical protein
MGDISKKTLVVLFIIAIVLSAIATWKMLSTPTTIVVQEGNSEGKSHVSFEIGGEEATPLAPVQKDGRVAFTVE